MLSRVILIIGLAALAGCTSSQFGLGVDLGSGAVTPSFSGTSGNATISIGG